jgi:hypothetical protein
VSSLQHFDAFRVAADLDKVADGKRHDGARLILTRAGGTSCADFGQHGRVERPSVNKKND